MSATADWRNGGVRVVRAVTLDQALKTPGAAGRATVFDFVGTGGNQTWIGAVTLAPDADTGPHDHGRHEVAVYVVKGRAQIRWGERLEFAAEIGPGDFAYFAPGVPHQERNLDGTETLDFVVVRSDNERITVKHAADICAEPELVY